MPYIETKADNLKPHMPRRNQSAGSFQMHSVFPDSITSGKGDRYTEAEPFSSTILCEGSSYMLKRTSSLYLSLNPQILMSSSLKTIHSHNFTMSDNIIEDKGQGANLRIRMINLSLMISAFCLSVLVISCFPFTSFWPCLFLISNLNPQQERAPHYPCRKIRTPYYCPTKKSSRGIFIRMKPPNRLKPHSEITMAQKRCQQGSELITESVTLKKATLEVSSRKQSTVRL